MRMKLTDKHPLMQKFNRILDVLEQEGIMIVFKRYGEIILTDTVNQNEFLILDAESNENVHELPPTFDYKVVKEEEIR